MKYGNNDNEYIKVHELFPGIHNANYGNAEMWFSL